MRVLQNLVPAAAVLLPPILLAILPTAVQADDDAATEPGEKLRRKYFHEPGGSLELGHYDARYFGGTLEYEEHRESLGHLVRSYLATFDRLGIETWLAHGTLLGWWWNGRIMPWDYDLDVQVSSATLYWMARHMNRTEHAYSYEVEIEVLPEEGGGGAEVNGGAGGNRPLPPAETTTPLPLAPQTMTVTRNKTYMLDINPHHVDLTRGDGMNIIDARWIDTSNGMFIDITGLAEREAESRPGVWSCKNYHRYAMADLWPMRTTEFEGVRATVPYSFEKILIEEYGSRSLVTMEWNGHKWEPAQKVWRKIQQ